MAYFFSHVCLTNRNRSDTQDRKYLGWKSYGVFLLRLEKHTFQVEKAGKRPLFHPKKLENSFLCSVTALIYVILFIVW